jgi:hypothetical protein
MPPAHLTDTVRRLVTETFAQTGLSRGAEPSETILIRGGSYCGRRFDAEEGHAVWFIEEEQVKFYRADGSMIRVVESVAGIVPSIRQAA